MSHNLVSTDWLAMRLQSPDIVTIDASWHLPTSGRNARAEFEAAHIPGARFYDLDAGSSQTSALPHMLPSPEKFAHDMAILGVDAKKTVVVYDAAGIFSAARLWWMLQGFGHRDTLVLDGGLPKWTLENHPLEKGKALSSLNEGAASPFDQNRVKTLGDVKSALDQKSAQVADARSPQRFRGEEPEPRPGVRPGHMPGAINVHYANLLNPDGTMKKPKALRQAFEAQGLDLKRPIISSCGSGISAAILMLALAELGVKDTSLYDGSWAEWGASAEAVATG